MAAYEVVPYRPEFRGHVAALQRHLWRGDEPANLAYLDWKYERNPYLPAPLIYLAVHDGRVIGMRGMFGSAWEVGPRGERFVVPCADDFTILPEHRKRGLFGRIMTVAHEDLAARGYRCAFSLSAGPVTLAGSLVSGWRSLGSVREMHRERPVASWRGPLGTQLRSWPLLWRWADLVSGRGGPAGRRLFRRLDARAPRARAGGKIWLGLEPRVDAMVELIARLGHDGRARHVRDAPYLTWRFANPLHEYRFLFAGADRLDGYLVLQAYRLGGRRSVNIVDWEAATPSVRTGLLRAALAWGRFAELSTWTITLPEAMRSLLREAGFAPAHRRRLAREGPHLLVRALDGAAGRGEPALGDRRLIDAADWDMRMLYSMAG
ncbi:MAG TPA: GNAT family N-acetyltransferase [Methylomirabilota bacterium]|nr:GNAT family N-acetyltransferase [Methylomirabilota bacterium]